MLTKVKIRNKKTYNFEFLNCVNSVYRGGNNVDCFVLKIDRFIFLGRTILIGEFNQVRKEGITAMKILKI